MSTIKDNLVQIREKLDTEKTQPSGGGVLEEVKKIRQVLDTDNTYPDGGGLAEEICAIRELVQDGKGGGKSRPDYAVQKCRITNNSNVSIGVHNSNVGTVKDSEQVSEYGSFGSVTISAGAVKDLFLSSIVKSPSPSKGPDYFLLALNSTILLRITGTSQAAPLAITFTNYPRNPVYLGSVTMAQGSGILTYQLFYAASASGNPQLPEVLEMTISNAS